jgi:hypothetical protein
VNFNAETLHSNDGGAMIRHVVRGLILGLLASRHAEAQSTAPTIPFLDPVPELSMWISSVPDSTGFVVDEFVQREPGDGVPASQRTRAWMVHDGSTLSGVFLCGEREPSKLRARLTRREAIDGDDQAGVMIDTFQDHRRAYLFMANPRAIQSDALLTDGQNDDFAFDALWDVDARITADGWWLRFAIHFKSLRMNKAPDQAWAIGLTRIIPRSNEQAFWPAVTRRVEGTVRQLAPVRLEQVDPGHDLQIVPYVVADTEAHRPRRDIEMDWRTQRAAGVDTKLTLRNAFALDATVNPDFSQVESDEPQVTSNQRFEVFFPEKRPFFLENAGFFQLGAVDLNAGAAEALFFSRRIVDPDAGVRITGRAGSWALGALAADDAAPGRRLAIVDPAFESGTTVGIARLQWVAKPGWTLAATGTHWGLESRRNDVGAFDIRARLRPQWVLAGWIAASRNVAGGGERSGSGANVHLKRSGRGAMVSLFYLDRSPQWLTELGFSPRTDIRLIEHYGEYRLRPSNNPVLAYGPNSFFRVGWDHRGELREWLVRFPFQVDLRGQTSIFVRHVESFDQRGTVGIRGHLDSFNFSTNWWRRLGFSETLDVGVAPNFFPAPGRPPEPIEIVTATFGANILPTPRLQIRTTYLYGRGRTSSGDTAVFDTHTARLRLAFQFTRSLALRGIIDYDNFHPNPAYTSRPPRNRLAPDVLFSYFVRPGTAFYAGYADQYADLDDAGAIGTGSPTTLSNRRFFTKLSYLLRF